MHRTTYRRFSNQEIDMQTLTPQQARQVHGAGPLDSALTRWYLYSLTGNGTTFPISKGDVQY